MVIMDTHRYWLLLYLQLWVNLGMKTACRFTNFQQMPGFERFSVNQFYLQSLGNYVNPLCMVLGWSPNMIRYCSMHTVNLGLVQFINASAIYTLVEDFNQFGTLPCSPASSK